MSDLISRRDALKAVSIGTLSAATVYGRSEAGMAAKREIERAIADLPSAQTEKAQLSREDTTSDCISRQEAIDAALSAADDWDGGCNKSRDKYITNALLDLPSVHPKFPENWWKTDHGFMWLCPHCGLPVHSDFEECLRCGIKRQSAQPEALTDKEQRIFLAAMARELKVCEETDRECRNCREPYEDILARVCKEIERKVKGALWT